MNGYTKRAIGEVLNNAVVMTQNPATAKKPLLKDRHNRLITYTRALIQPAIDQLEDEDFTPEELVYAFTVAALWIHTFRILKSDKLPMVPTTKEFFEKAVDSGIAQMEVKCPNCKKKFEV